MSLEKQAVEEFRNNNFNESLKLLKKFIESNPNSYEAYNFLGIVYLKLKKYNFAKNSWEKASNINANYIDPLINIANLFVFVAEQRLSGCNAQDRRVTAEWLKTPEVVFSTDHLFHLYE